MSETKKKLFLLDAYALIYRAYYAFIRAPRINSKGLNTSAMFGFTNTLNEILSTYKPTHIAVAFDISGPVFRNDDFPAYKANREETPDDIKLSIPIIRKIVEGFNIPILEKVGFEADDIIGTIAKEAEKNGFEVFMVTPDKDFAQLVSKNIFMLKPARMGNKSEIWGIPEVLNRFEVERPEQVIDILGLWGDSVDNIPGIPGVGEKTAKKFIQEFGSVENLLENSASLKGKMKENVENYKEQAILSKKLATIICDVPIDFDPVSLELEEPNKEALMEIFSYLEFRTMAERILGAKVNASAPSGGDQMDLFSENGSEAIEEVLTEMETFSKENAIYKLIETKDKRDTFIKAMLKQKEVCFDTETTSIDANEAQLVGMSFSWKKGEAFYIPIPENEMAAKFILQDFKPFFESKDILKIGHNLKYDLTVLNWIGIKVQEPYYDTMLAHYLLQPDQKHNMDALSEIYLNYRPISITELIGKKGKNQKNMRDIEVDIVKDYACEDADITLQLYHKFQPLLKESNTEKLFKEIEMPLVPVLAEMETAGIRLDKDALAEISIELEKDLISLEEEIYNLAECSFNISSPKQLGEILFDKLKILEKAKKTKSGQYATNEETLMKLENKHPIINQLLEYRQIKKLKSTYVDALPALINPRDGRVHTTYMQAVAATGRLSSQNPNLQNIPIKTARGREVRKAFVPRDSDHCILAADYSQIELRLIAELSQDEGMKAAFLSGEDIHSATASKVFDVSSGEVTREMRNKAKMVNFGIIYGISAFGLSQRLNISRTEAAEIIKQYFLKYPGIQEYMSKSMEFARKNGFVETIMKRRRYLSDINSGNAVVRGYAERNAINAPIQGSAADMIKIAMIHIHREFQKLNIQSKMLLQVHDELVFDALCSELDIIKPIISDKMVNAIPSLSIPMSVEMDVGENWLEAH